MLSRKQQEKPRTASEPKVQEPLEESIQVDSVQTLMRFMLESRERRINAMNNVIGKMVMTLVTGWKPNAKWEYQLLVGQERRDHDLKRRYTPH